MRHRLYLETSFWKRLADPASPEMRRASFRFLRAVQDRDRLLISGLVTRELERTPDAEERRRLRRRLRSLRLRTITNSPAVREIARDLLASGGWSGRRVADMLHVGYAVFGGADALVTWDRADLARERTRRVVREYGRKKGLPVPRIGTPEEVARWLGLQIR